MHRHVIFEAFLCWKLLATQPTDELLGSVRHYRMLLQPHPPVVPLAAYLAHVLAHIQLSVHVVLHALLRDERFATQFAFEFLGRSGRRRPGTFTLDTGNHLVVLE